MTPKHADSLVTLKMKGLLHYNLSKNFFSSLLCYKSVQEMNKLVEEAKALNIPRRNLRKKDQFKQTIKDIVDRYKEIIDVICKGCLNELKKKN